MFKRPILGLLILLLLPGLIQATEMSLTRKAPTPATLTGLEDMPTNALAVYPPYHCLPQTNSVDLIGDTVAVGTTWYETQHNSQIGRMIVKDDSGYVHIVWTKGLDEASNNRHVYYSYITPQGEIGIPDGRQVDAAQRGGFATLAVGWEGRAFVAFHQRPDVSANNHSAVAFDFFPHTGAFMTLELPWFGGEDREFIWPHIAMKLDGQMLILNRENGTSYQSWSLGTYDPVGFTITYTDQELTENASAICSEVGASKISNRVGVAYPAPAFPQLGYPDPGEDIHAMVDDDGLDLNFGNWWNVTDFIPPDTSWLPDTLLADADTLRAWADCNLFFDMDDVCHITFTTIYWLTLEGGLTYYNASCIWHWCETWPNDFHLVARAWQPENTISCGNWSFRAQRPCVSQDASTGYLYCLYQQYDVDTTHIAASGYPSADQYISVSVDGGQTWSVGTNITNTITPGGAQAGQCFSECYASMAEKVDEFCYITYVLDYDAGQAQASEGSITLNPIIFHKVPVDSIATYPVMESTPFHVEHIEDTTATATGSRALPTIFALEQNVPNPFNSRTAIRFSLAGLSNVELSVYSLRGELVATIVSGVYQAGTHTVGFNASRLASGVYICRLRTEGKSLERKMVLMK